MSAFANFTSAAIGEPSIPSTIMLRPVCFAKIQAWIKASLGDA
jgi:hypothetical protein